MDAVISIDKQQRITLFNPAAAKTFGCAASEALGQPLERFIPQRFRTAHAEHVRLFSQSKLTQKAMTERQEISGLRADGTEFPIEASISKTQVGDQKTFTVILRDITERKRAEAALRDSEAKFRAVVENSHDGIIFYDADGVIRYRSPSFQRITGFAAEERLGHSGFETVHPDDLASVRGTWTAVLSQPETPHALCYRIQHKDGTWRTVESRFVNLLGSPTVQAIVLSLRDVTESKRAQDQLVESETQFRTVANAIPTLCWMAKVDGWISWYNRRWYDYTGTTPEQMEGWGWQSVHDPTVLPDVLKSWERSIATGEPFEMVFPLRGADGVFRPFLTRVLPLLDRDGKIVRWFGTNTDISEQQKVQEALRQRAEELEKVMEVAPVAIWVAHDPHCHEITGNRMANQIFEANDGENVSANASSGSMVPRRRFFRDGRELAAEDLPLQEAAARDVDVKGTEVDVILPSGRHISLLGSATPLRDAAGQVRGTIAAFVEITERKRAEEALQRSESDLKQAHRVARLGSWEWDPKTDTVTWSEQIHRVFGSDPNLGVPGVADQARLFTPESWTRLEAALAEAVRSGTPYELDLEVVRVDGTRAWMIARGEAERDADGKVGKLRGTVQDITERKIAEEALRRQANILDLAPVLVRDLQNRIILWTQGAEKLYGYTAEEALGRVSHELLQTVFPGPLDQIEQTLNTSGSWEGELLHRTRDGSRIVNASKWVLDRDRAGNAVCVLDVNTDITARKTAEEALARRTMELERSNADLEQFAYVASHDLKEPLRAVAGFVRLLQRRYEGKFDARANEFIAGAIDGGTRMQTLIDDLLAFSRVRTRGAKFDAVECQKALDMALQNIALAIRESGAVVSHDPLPAVRGDAAQLASLFQNLIGNALKFHGAAPPRIHVAAQRNGTHWQFSVRDNGIGIESQYFGRIFGIFQRLHTRREYPGTGIGLAICKKIVERHEGRIWLESVPGEGSTFFFTLPDTQVHDRPLEREIHA